MKWAALVILLAGIIPLSGWLRRNPKETPKILMIMGFLTFVLQVGRPEDLHLYMSVISFPWPGYVKGFEFSVVDALTLALYLSLPSARQPLPFQLSMALYFLVALLSAIQAEVPMAALFYPWQLARMFLVYAVVTRACADPGAAPALLKGMAAAIFLQAAISIWQRFGSGVLQTGGTFDSQNFLGLMSHFVVFPYFALLLAGQRGWLPVAVLLAGIIIEVLTASRATLGLAGFAFAAVFTLSALRQWTSRKALVLAIGVTTTAVLAPLALLSVEQRGQVALDSSTNERVVLETAAGMMLSDYPWGVGANHYVLIANIRGYNLKAGVNWTSDSATVHNVYWLVAAETGYLGLITFVLFLLHPLIVALRCGWRNRGDPRGDLLLGLGVALLTVYIHSMFEWIFITFRPQYIFALELGLVAGLAQQLGYWRRPFSQGAQLGAGTLPIRPTGERAMPGSVALSPTIVGPAGDRSNGIVRR